jgi:hypothetical protein
VKVNTKLVKRNFITYPAISRKFEWASYLRRNYHLELLVHNFSIMWENLDKMQSYHETMG